MDFGFGFGDSPFGSERTASHRKQGENLEVFFNMKFFGFKFVYLVHSVE
jgi:hypothetical protein